MNIGAILKFIVEETPSHAKEIWSAIDLLLSTIDNTRSAIDGALGKLASNREYDKVKEYAFMSEELAKLLDQLNQYTKQYALQEDMVQGIIEDEEYEEDGDNALHCSVSNNEKINYEKYRVDENVAYNLYTDFTHKKPAAFSINGKKYFARKWKYVFIQTCEILVNKNATIFSSFVRDDTMQGRTRTYFSTIESDIKKPKNIKGTNIFVETNLNANNIRNIIINMLEKYNIPKSQYQIYLSKDLSGLHTDNNCNVGKQEGEEDSSDEEYHM